MVHEIELAGADVDVNVKKFSTRLATATMVQAFSETLFCKYDAIFSPSNFGGC